MHGKAFSSCHRSIIKCGGVIAKHGLVIPVPFSVVIEAVMRNRHNAGKGKFSFKSNPEYLLNILNKPFINNNLAPVDFSVK
jgi:hypothetical protein